MQGFDLIAIVKCCGDFFLFSNPQTWSEAEETTCYRFLPLIMNPTGQLGPNAFFEGFLEKKTIGPILIICIVCTVILLWNSICFGQGTGLEVLQFNAPQKSIVGDSEVSVIRINPREYRFRLLCASELGKKKRTAKEWCAEFGLMAAINASMFRQDQLTSTGFMKNYKHFNNSKRNPNYNSFLVFSPVSPGLPDIRLLDLQCDDFAAIEPQYNSVIQNLRMISCKRKNVWSQQNKKWSISSLGVDGKGNVLFIFSRFPYSVHDFINILLGLDIDIQRTMYLEGGPEASVYLKTAERELALFGSYETGFNENHNNDRFWPIPNVIGVSPR